MRTYVLAAAACALVSSAASAVSIETAYTRTSAAELITAPFTSPVGTATTGLYSGFVEINVGGVGQSEAADFNDAFFLYNGGLPIGNFYKLGAGTTVTPFLAGSQASFVGQYITFIEGPGDVPTGTIPAYNATHNYRFVIDLGAQAPTKLTFGVTDGQYNDNSGSFNLTVYQLAAGGAVPEPASWALMLVGFGGMGYAMRRNRKVAVSFS